jgi:hypothetical protein
MSHNGIHLSDMSGLLTIWKSDSEHDKEEIVDHEELEPVVYCDDECMAIEA